VGTSAGAALVPFRLLSHHPFEMEATVKCDRSGVESKATITGRSGGHCNLSQMTVPHSPDLW